MVNKRSLSEEQINLLDDGDKPKKRRLSTNVSKESRKKQKSDDEDQQSTGINVEEEEEEESAEEEELPKKHIRPCVCDLTKAQRKKIGDYLQQREIDQKRYEKRVKEIELELARIEEERLERERELQEQEELFGDEYEMVGKKKKRKKRSARRASMVSLGVKQIINWRKPPRIKVKYTHASQLRKKYHSYCGISECPESPPCAINFRKEPDIPIRATHTSDLRTETNTAKKQFLIKHEDKRPRFETCWV